MKKLLFATLALVLVLATGCKNEESKTDPQQQETKISCKLCYVPEGEIMEGVDLEIYVNDSLVCTLNDSLNEYNGTFDKKATTTIETKPVINTEAPTAKFDIKYSFSWRFTDGYTTYADGSSQNAKGCDYTEWEDFYIPYIKKGLTYKFVIENGKVPTGPVE